MTDRCLLCATVLKGLRMDLVKLIETVGYAGIFAIIFAESGLFFGFFLPGDSLLLTAGLLASRGILNEFILVPGLFIAAVLGDQVGYWFGAKTGPLIFNRENSLALSAQELVGGQGVLRKARRQDRHPGALFALYPHLCAHRGGRGGDEL